MPNPGIWLFAIAVAFLAIAAFVYGTGVLIFPTTCLLGYFLTFGATILQAEMHSSEIPGLEKLEEPDFWSTIRNAWLYVKDREAWLRQASLFSFIGGFLLGLFLGFLALTLISLPSNEALLVSWVSGVLLTLSVAMLMVKYG